MPLGEVCPQEQGGERGATPCKGVILPLLARLAWKLLQIDTDMLFIVTSTGDELLRRVNIDDLMTLSDHEPPKSGGLVIFSRFHAATHISRVNCAEMAGDRPRQPAYKILAFECKF